MEGSVAEMAQQTSLYNLVGYGLGGVVVLVALLWGIKRSGYTLVKDLPAPPKSKEDSGTHRRVDRAFITECPMNPGLALIQSKMEQLVVLHERSATWLEILAIQAIGKAGVDQQKQEMEEENGIG